MLKKSMTKYIVLFLFFLVPFIYSCSKKIDPVGPNYLVGVREDPAYFLSHLSPKNQKLNSWQGLAPTLRKSLSYVKAKKPTDFAIQRPGLKMTWGQMAYTLEQLESLLPSLDENPRLFLERFQWIPIYESIMYSAYYEPVLKASRTYKEGYTPLYKTPPDLAKTRRRGRDYHTRADIDWGNALAGRGLELVWVESFVDAYYLQIQGSGKLVFENGDFIYVNYAAQNGHDYVSSGRIMREKGLVKRGDVAEQKEWFKNNPERIREIFEENPSYVFFRFNEKGATGAMTHVVDPWTSLATDRRFIPLGSIVAYGVNMPTPSGIKALRGIGFAQDVGGAIKKNRIDIFAGGGEQAEYTASHLDAMGPAWVLVSKDVF